MANLSGRLTILLTFFVIPAKANIIAILRPLARSIGFRPVALQLRFELVIPGRISFSVLRAGAIAEPIGIFGFFVGGRAARRDQLLAGSLFDGVIHVLVRIGFGAAQIMFGLVPIALECRLNSVPTGFMVLSPPF